MPPPAAPSPLALVALAFVGDVRDGVTASRIVAEFAAADAVVSKGSAKKLLDDLSSLGLARPVRQEDSDDEYVLTPLGERLLSTTFAGRQGELELLGEVEQMRTDLLATVAHEVRTPLTAVRTSVGLLLDSEVEPSAEQRRALLETIDRNATRMQRVVSDILDLARFRAGRVHLQLRRFDAIELAQSAISSVALLAEARGQRIDLEVPRTPVRVFGDYRRLEQALVNLLSNAEKYSPECSPITVSVRADASEVSWSVRDRGHGIKPEDQARLFERFFVAGRSRSEATDGVGLGLPIALLIVHAHEGRIDVASELGRGSTFSIVVPMGGPTEVPTE